MRAACVLTVTGVALFTCLNIATANDAGARSPHDGHHLLIVAPASLTDEDGKKPSLQADAGAKFGPQAVDMASPVQATLHVRHAGQYALWLRVGASKNAKPLVQVAVRSDQRELLRVTVGQGRGGDKEGGPAGYEAFARLAAKSGPAREVAVDPPGKPTDLDDVLKDLEGKNKTETNWATFTRLEQPLDARPFYWWKAGVVKLAAGTVVLHLHAPGAKPNSVLLDGGFLSTNDKLSYPYVGDVNAPRSSFVRFRLDKLPKAGVTIAAGLRIHADPWSTPRVWLNPDKLNTTKAETHTRPGLTRWYRLQDIPRAPGFGASEAHLHLDAHSAGKEHVVGATQFAVVPHDNFVLREIAWDEPEGMNLSLVTDFETYPQRLRTLRDHAREHYDKALTATQGQLFPLTRGDLYFGNAWGAASGECADYMNKTLRLLGFNSVGASHEPIRYRTLYGWTSSAGHYWPPAHLPYDEAKAKTAYDDHYRGYFTKQEEFYRGVTTFQVADEPGEIARNEMTAPLWRWEKDARGGKWSDPAGNSDLHTRRVDHRDCVLEGQIEQHGSWVGFRVGLDDALAPKRYAYWHVGAVSVNREMNLATGRNDTKQQSVSRRPAARVAATPTPFKIVLDGPSAALYLNGQLVHQHSDLPTRGGLGITGGPKAIRALSLRPLRKEERLEGKLLDGPAKKELDPEELLTKPQETPKTKPLEQFVREDWVACGGMREAHEAFRTWAAQQQLQPQLFGKKNWDEVHLLTLPNLVQTPEEARLFYWSRRFSGQLTPRMFNLAADAIRRHAPNRDMRGFVALSGHALYFPSAQPLDTFQLAEGDAMMPGISDWMSLGGWFWDSHQAVAFSLAPFNAGARRHGQEPRNFPMMHCVWPSSFRAYTMLANQARYISFYNFGPSYAVTEGYWSEDASCYEAVQVTANRAAQIDDVLANARMRPSRVALLYSMANEYWNPQASFADKRAAFLALSHDYFQPELVTEEQVAAGALKHYDALYVLDPIVAAASQERIAEWTRNGGLLWTCADALSRNEFNEPHDLLARLVSVKREAGKPSEATVAAVPGTLFQTHKVVAAGRPTALALPDKATVRARYENGSPAWAELALGKGKVVYVGHRAGLTYSSHKNRQPGRHTIWTDIGRAPLTLPLSEAGVARALTLSEPALMASVLSAPGGSVIVLHDMEQGPRRNLRITLAEAAKPHSVQAFKGMTLEPMPFEYKDGRVTLTLPELQGGQMILVRRTPAPRDDRLEEMRQRTLQQLESSDPLALSAGAWFAGFFPAWKLGDRLLPLLTHARWEVRRAAVESLSRLNLPAVGDRLAALALQEKDTHVLADTLLALARLRHPQAEELCRKYQSHRDPFVSRQAEFARRELERGRN